jgi:hypothetical protein
MLNNRLKKILPAPLYQCIRKKYVAGVGKFSRKNLRRLAELHGTDKVYGHNYIEVYAQHFEKFRKLPVTFLEIGVGGYDDPQAGGQSLRMWRDYFYKGRIHALDIFDKSPHQEPRIKIYQGSQADKQCLESIHNETGDFDLIIDDGSHLNEHIITSFEILFPLLKKGGIYVVEDIQTAYWPTYGGQNQPGADNTAMSFFRNLADGLNYKEYLIPDYLPTFYDQHIVSLHFYHNMVVIYKGENNCPSNLVSGGVLQPH